MTGNFLGNGRLSGSRSWHWSGSRSRRSRKRRGPLETSRSCCPLRRHLSHELRTIVHAALESMQLDRPKVRSRRGLERLALTEHGFLAIKSRQLLHRFHRFSSPRHGIPGRYLQLLLRHGRSSAAASTHCLRFRRDLVLPTIISFRTEGNLHASTERVTSHRHPLSRLLENRVHDSKHRCREADEASDSVYRRVGFLSIQGRFKSRKPRGRNRHDRIQPKDCVEIF